jgi:hypothetical protein
MKQYYTMYTIIIDLVLQDKKGWAIKCSLHYLQVMLTFFIHIQKRQDPCTMVPL